MKHYLVLVKGIITNFIHIEIEYIAMKHNMMDLRREIKQYSSYANE
jgi:hypothetical protein